MLSCVLVPFQKACNAPVGVLFLLDVHDLRCASICAPEGWDCPSCRPRATYIGRKRDSCLRDEKSNVDVVLVECDRKGRKGHHTSWLALLNVPQHVYESTHNTRSDAQTKAQQSKYRLRQIAHPQPQLTGPRRCPRRHRPTPVPALPPPPVVVVAPTTIPSPTVSKTRTALRAPQHPSRGLPRHR